VVNNEQVFIINQKNGIMELRIIGIMEKNTFHHPLFRYSNIPRAFVTNGISVVPVLYWKNI
jgi:hypothetical protein